MYARFGLFIAGEWRASVSGATAPVFSPVTEQSLGECPVASVADTGAALGAAAQGFTAWAATPAFDRADALHRIADEMLRRADEAARMISLETGKPIAQSGREWGLSIDQFRWYAEEATRIPGEFRRTQNWIGGAGCTLTTASFVPPPPHELMNALDGLEKFLHQGRHSLPLLVRCGLAHAQFETIHPFLDGNGRVGRLLITLLLCEEGALTRPLLYLSVFLKAHRAEYYDRLTAIRTHGHWEAWLKFFLRGVSTTARAATQTARDIVALQAAHRAALANNAYALKLLDHLYQQPYVNAKTCAQVTGCSMPTAIKLLEDLRARTWLHETTGQQRNRVYRYQPYLDLFHRDTVQSVFETQFTPEAP